MPHAHTHDHAHGHATHAGHSHGVAEPKSVNALRLAFFVNLAFTIVEAVGGWWTESLAVLTDALHDAGDCLVLGVAWWLQRVAMKGRDAQNSYGYGRYSMLGGWLTSVALVVGALAMLVVTIPHLWHTHLPDATGMMVIAVFGLAMNGFAAWKLHGGHSLNERGAYLHLLEDVLGWAAVLVGAIVIRFTGWAFVDPLMGIGISIFILYNAIGTLRTGTRILMQEVPAGIDLGKVHEQLLAIGNVVDVHDQHIWSLDGTYTIHTVHLVVEANDLVGVRSIKEKARHVLTEAGIQHATIELEWADEPCALEHH